MNNLNSYDCVRCGKIYCQCGHEYSLMPFDKLEEIYHAINFVYHARRGCEFSKKKDLVNIRDFLDKNIEYRLIHYYINHGIDDRERDKNYPENKLGISDEDLEKEYWNTLERIKYQRKAAERWLENKG